MLTLGLAGDRAGSAIIYLISRHFFVGFSGVRSCPGRACTFDFNFSGLPRRSCSAALPRGVAFFSPLSRRERLRGLSAGIIVGIVAGNLFQAANHFQIAASGH